MKDNKQITNHESRITKKTTIRRKVTLVICLAILVIMAITMPLVYFISLNTSRKNISNEYIAMSRLLSHHILQVYKGEIEDVETYATRPLWIDAIKEKNLTYRGISPEAMQREFKDMDREWASAAEDSRLVKEYTDNRVAVSMREIMGIRKNVGEVFITDKFGGLVAASEKTTDYYQADEAWWQEAYNAGKGKVFVGDIEFDESSRQWVIPIAIPMHDDNGSIIGICKEGVSVSRFFNHLKDFKVGNTGHATLVDRNNNILFHPDTIFMSRQFSSSPVFKKLLIKEDGYLIINSLHDHKSRIFAAFSRVNPPYLIEQGVFWIILIEQNEAEVFAPLGIFILQLAFIFVTIIIIMAPLGYFLGGIFTKPILKLHLATERVIRGDWDYKIEAKTGDEIEEFADAFKTMILQLKKNQYELINAKTELEDLSGNLEKKVEERTSELTQAQEASLNILEDLAEAKVRLEKNAEDLERALNIKSIFTSTVSHELRTPLAAIKEGIAIVLDKTAGELNKNQKEFLNIAKKNVDRLSRLINDILDFQRLESGKVAFRMEEHDINEAIKDVYSTMAALVEAKGLVFNLHLSPNLPKVVFDNDKIIQILTNLVDNAIKCTEKGSISISSAHKENFIEVSVQDTGAGIKKEDMPKLFTQFMQLETHIERKTGSTGLGLAICKQIIEAHKGRIWAESEPGKGTVFHFTLPEKRKA